MTLKFKMAICMFMNLVVSILLKIYILQGPGNHAIDKMDLRINQFLTELGEVVKEK